uniref:Uncharacterized protein n=1 Tax=Tanacetum cinerariifolium TaxID=118510 RepID=A0A699KGX2_TANCI|nr:hypothetical protein [Tanacetum cinerariifolium]
MSTPIDFSTYIKNGLKIINLTQETLLRPAFRLLKGTCTNYVELEYNFEECYKALSEKLDWENPKGCDYPFDLTKPLPLVKIGNHQKSPVKVAYDKHALWGISHWRDQRKSFYGYARGLESTHDVCSTKRILIVTLVGVMRKHGLMRLDELYKFRDGTLTRLQTSLEDITKNIYMEYMQKRRCSTLEKKQANIMIKTIDKKLEERRMMRSLKKFVGGRHYRTDLWLL